MGEGISSSCATPRWITILPRDNPARKTIVQALSPTSIEPREYQKSIAESAASANTLVVLPTGLGKTIIALLVAEKRLQTYPDQKVLILAPTRPLVLQHAEFFEKHYPEKNIRSTILTGEVAPQSRARDFENATLIFATPEVVRNDVTNSRYDLRKVCLIVFDEAHRCVQDYAYTSVAEAYKSQASTPLILALTASPSARKSRVQEICESLAIQKVETRTEKDPDVTNYVKDVTVDWVRLPLLGTYKQATKALHDAFDQRVDKLRAMHQLPGGLKIGKRMLLELGQRLHERLRRGGSGALYGAVVLQSQAMSLSHAIDLLETQGAYSANRFLLKLDRAKTKSARGLAKDPQVIEAQKLCANLLDIPHPKEIKLRELVKNDLALNARAKIIVFTQFRDTVEMIADSLNHLDGVQAVRFVGQATRSEEDVGLTQTEQMEILEDFREGKYNLLVTTSIGEEGLHVPDVDHVIFYEAVPSEIRMIQRRGRTGRTRPGKTTVLMTEGTVDEAYYWTSKRKEEQMHRTLAGITSKPTQRRRTKSTLLDYA
jgi:ERCC4-related helicase